MVGGLEWLEMLVLKKHKTEDMSPSFRTSISLEHTEYVTLFLSNTEARTCDYSTSQVLKG